MELRKKVHFEHSIGNHGYETLTLSRKIQGKLFFCLVSTNDVRYRILLKFYNNEYFIVENEVFSAVVPKIKLNDKEHVLSRFQMGVSSF